MRFWMGTRVPAKQGAPLIISGSILTTDWLAPPSVGQGENYCKSFDPECFWAGTDLRLTHSTSSGQAPPPLQQWTTTRDEAQLHRFLYPKKPRRRMISATCGGTISSQVSSPLAMRLSTSRENIGRYLGLWLSSCTKLPRRTR